MIIQCDLTCLASNSTPQYTPQGIENKYSNKHLYLDVHCSTIHNSQKVGGKIQMSINWWMEKRNVVYPYNGILFSRRKEWSTDLYYNIDEPQKHYAKWKKSSTKDNIVYDSPDSHCPTHFNMLLHSPICCFNVAVFQANKNSRMSLGSPVVFITTKTLDLLQHSCTGESDIIFNVESYSDG